ncbi:MAG: hypothetical protein HYU28_00980 [Actinobacteria bacterium]|nr:hypothetical protein [Actinomycetota bacterium]
MTNAEAVLFQTMAGVGLVGGVVQRGRFRRAGRAEQLAREHEKWEANAAFMRSLDLDPVTVLGPPPSPELGESLPARAGSGLVVR